MNRIHTLLVLIITGVAVVAVTIGTGLFVYGYAVAPLPEAPELYQRGYTSFVSRQEHSAVCRGAGAALVVLGLFLAAALVAVWCKPPWARFETEPAHGRGQSL